MSPTRVDWQFTPATSRWLRRLVYLAVGLTVGPFLGLVVLVGWLLVVEGAQGLLVLVLAVALLAGLGVGSGRALFALVGERGVHEDSRSLSNRWLAASVLVGAGGAAVALRTTDAGFGMLVGSLLAGLAALVVGAGLRSEGAVDVEERTLSYGSHTIPLAAVRRCRSLAIGPFAVVLLGYRRDAVGPSTPRVVVCSNDAVAALDAVRASTPESTGAGVERKPNTAVRVVAAGFGVACLVVGPVLWFVVPESGRLVVVYLGVFGLLFGAVFVRYAVVA